MGNAHLALHQLTKTGQVQDLHHLHRHQQVFQFKSLNLNIISILGQLALSSTGQSAVAPSRRRGFGGFAGTVPAPAIIQSLPAVPQLALPTIEQSGNSAGESPGAIAEPALTAPQLVIPKLGADTPPIAVAGQQAGKI